ncbi:hypothetical protein [Hallella mizrahii]|uniref:Uncharacterized protein n=1 Tax=Hallella mizrahii TaxID=2606637 RepID=A0A7K0KEY8_9BACT|nr:hypothetical protein [Hallella mizrahii]MST84501.1 hypothetical protein [Hallella mizrahii]
MEIKILHPNVMLSTEEATNIKGGFNSSFGSMECTCDCFISNKNEEKPTPQKPSKPIKGLA